MPERAADASVELEHQQLHRDDPIKAKASRPIHKRPLNQPVYESAA